MSVRHFIDLWKLDAAVGMIDRACARVEQALAKRPKEGAVG